MKFRGGRNLRHNSLFKNSRNIVNGIGFVVFGVDVWGDVLVFLVGELKVQNLAVNIGQRRLGDIEFQGLQKFQGCRLNFFVVVVEE